MPFAKKVKGEYKACDTLPNKRRILARVAVALQKRDIPILVIHEILRECGYDVAPRTLYRHVKGINDGVNILAHETEARGRLPILDEPQTDLVIGYVLQKNSENSKVTLSKVRKFIQKELTEKISLSFVHSTLQKAGFSSRRMKCQAKGYKVDDRCLAQLHLEWVKKYTPLIFTGVDHTNVCSFDFTYTGHRTDAVYGYARK